MFTDDAPNPWQWLLKTSCSLRKANEKPANQENIPVNSVLLKWSTVLMVKRFSEFDSQQPAAWNSRVKTCLTPVYPLLSLKYIYTESGIYMYIYTVTASVMSSKYLMSLVPFKGA